MKEKVLTDYTEAEIRAHYDALTRSLIREGKTITTMESCTSGQLASLITDTEGASAVLKGAFVTYSNMAKILQGVPAETIEHFGVYSRETARDMALAAQRSLDADYAIGVTGSMGNVDPANADSVPGQIYYAIARKNGPTISCETSYLELPPQPGRLRYKLLVAEAIYQTFLSLMEVS